MSQTPRNKTEAKLYDALVSFNATAQWDILRLAQMRQYLAEHLADALVPSWLHERKAQTAAEEIAHVLLMVGLMPSDWVDAHRTEVLAADGQAYDGELAMLRGLVRVLRVAARNNELAEVQALLMEHVRDEQAARAREKSSREADATPGPTGRIAQLLDAIRARPNTTWTTSKAFEIYRLLPAHAGMPLGQIRAFARSDLRDLAAWGHLTVSDQSGRREYRLKRGA